MVRIRWVALDNGIALYWLAYSFVLEIEDGLWFRLFSFGFCGVTKLIGLLLYIGSYFTFDCR